MDIIYQIGNFIFGTLWILFGIGAFLGVCKYVRDMDKPIDFDKYWAEIVDKDDEEDKAND